MSNAAISAAEAKEAEMRAAEILGRVRRIELRTQRFVNDALAGRFASVFKGRGMDFDRVRNYVPGDDVRTIDWNVTARTGDTHIKLFTEERELTILLAVDVSASADFGSAASSKRETAAEAAAVLAASAIRTRDRVGLLLFTDQVELYIPPGKGRLQMMRLIREILFFQPQHQGTHLTKALDVTNHLLHRRAVVFLFSDFCLPPPLAINLADFKKKLQITYRRHDVIAVAINDAREAELPNVGLLRIQDAESGETMTLDTAKRSVREAYAKKSRERRQQIATAIRSLGIDMLEMTNGEAWMPEWLAFFKTHRQRSGA